MDVGLLFAAKHNDIMKTQLGIFGILVLALGAVASPLAASAQTYQQVVSTDTGTIKVGISTDPATPKSGDQTKLKIDFLNPKTSSIQEHVDYTVSVTNGGNAIFGPIPLTHTSIGTVSIPIQFKDGDNRVVIDVQGILFQPIPSEKASFSITLGDKQPTQPKEEPKTASKPTQKPTEQKQSEKPKTGSVSGDANKNTKLNEDKKSKDTPKKADTIKVNVKKPAKTDTKKDSKKDTKKISKTAQTRVIKAPKLQKPKEN